MADRYQDRPFPSQDSSGAGRGDSDPLAELARLIGQTDPFGAAPKASAQPSPPAPHPLQSRANIQPHYDDQPEDDANAAPSPPSWMQRARTSAPPPVQEPVYQQEPAYQYEEPEYEQPAPVHPLHRYAAQQPPAQEYYDDAPQEPPGHGAPHYAGAQAQHEPARYDDALYGRLESGEQDYQRDPAYPDDPYAYQNEYAEEPEPKKRSSGLVTVAAVLALAVVGTGAAFGYRTYVGSPRSGEPPIIKADNSPTKVVPAPSDAAASKTPDRMVPGDGGEKLVSREERPVDVNARSGAPRVVFPPLNQNGSPPPVASVTPSGPAPAGGANGTLPNNEPRKIKTLAVKGDAADNGGVPPSVAPPAARPVPAAPRATAPAAPARNPASANASANAPMSLAPQGAPEPASG
ncbi:MAG: SPOR domain-containing protein, partial [bacterium]|nr:SPOR domain-containing protein [bacterium]